MSDKVDIAAHKQIMSAAYQLENRDRWQAEAEAARHREIKTRLTSDVEHLWCQNGSYAELWEEDFFPDAAKFLDELQDLGYHVYISSSRRNNSGRTQLRYLISPEPLGPMYSERRKHNDNSG